MEDMTIQEMWRQVEHQNNSESSKYNAEMVAELEEYVTKHKISEPINRFQYVTDLTNIDNLYGEIKWN